MALPTSKQLEPNRAVTAEVQTMHVEIRALMVGKKQFTISMFKQLDELDMFQLNETGPYLLGEPWGTVNYSMKSWVAERMLNGSVRTVYRWIIWSADGELFRCPYPSHPNIYGMNFEHIVPQDKRELVYTLPQLFIAV